MKKNPIKKTAKKTSKKNATKLRQLREDKITDILDLVSKICDYAIHNLCTQQSHFEELEWKLRDAIR